MAAFGPLDAAKHGYRGHTLDHAHPAQAEPLVDVRTEGLLGRNHYAAAFNPPYDGPVPGAVEGLWLRRGVLDRLHRVESGLRPHGLRLFVLDAWRPQAVQAYFHHTWMPAWLRTNRSELSEAEIAALVPSYWAAPSSSRDSPSPHSTGGAVDLTLVHADGSPVWMGSLFDDVTEIAHIDAFEGRELSSMTDLAARAGRRVLHHAMLAEGFAPNPTEWWHFSYGDQLWARLTGAAVAVYGETEPS